MVATLVAAGCGRPATGAEEEGEQTEGPGTPITSVPAARGVPLARAVLYKPQFEESAPVDVYLAPLLYLEQADSDSGAGQQGRPEPLVSVAESTWTPSRSTASQPTQEYRQLIYRWQLNPEDAALRGLRITFDSDGYPALFELIDDGSGQRVVFASEDLEEAAREANGPPLPGRRFALEADLATARELELIEVVSTGAAPMGPFVYEAISGAGVFDLHCRCSPSQVDELTGTVEYALVPWEQAPPHWLEAPGFLPPDEALAGLRLPETF